MKVTEFGANDAHILEASESLKFVRWQDDGQIPLVVSNELIDLIQIAPFGLGEYIAILARRKQGDIAVRVKAEEYKAALEYVTFPSSDKVSTAEALAVLHDLDNLNVKQQRIPILGNWAWHSISFSVAK